MQKEILFIVILFLISCSKEQKEYQLLQGNAFGTTFNINYDDVLKRDFTKQIDSLIAVCSPSQFDKIDLKVWNMGIKENIVYTFFQEGRIGKGVRPGSLWIKKVKPIDIIGKITIPIYFMHGVEDWLILPWHSEVLFKKANDPKKIELIEGATHAEYIFRSFPDDTIKRFKTWFAETLKN